MKRIRHLPEFVHSSLRSSILLCDLTRVVEELVYNSLDAGAKKVSIYIGLLSGCVKVVDDGSGITRDGLELLGERYATSKFQNMDNIDVTSRSFGFRGEALGSISDVSSLEILTKAHGRPNGFRKVIKGCKCLFLGIDDNRQDVGTTVIVRDLFYNQPVRRKQMQSSLKKVMHSVKKCVLQIALMHSTVSFEVFDIESEEELLCIHPSSAISLLARVFGTKVSSSLHEINLSEGALNFHGYVSGPFSTSFVEAFQYVYINLRFVQKTPIHKLLNQLASRFNCVEPWSSNKASPNYIFNLSCPRSLYDLAFEPSKTSVEFKDWDPILSFIGKSVTHIWNKNVGHVDSNNLEADVSKRDVMLLMEDSSFVLEKDNHLLENSKVSSCRSGIQNLGDLHGLAYDAIELLPENQIDSPFQPEDSYLTKCTSTATKERNNSPSSQDRTLFSEKDYYPDGRFVMTERLDDYREDDPSGSGWGHFHEVDGNTSNPLSVCIESGNELDGLEIFNRKLILYSGLQQGSPTGWMHSPRQKRFGLKMESCGTKRRRFDPDDKIDTVAAVCGNEGVDFMSSTLWHDEVATACSSFGIIEKFDMLADAEPLGTNSFQSSPYDECFLARKDNCFLPATVACNGDSGLSNLSYFEPEFATPDLQYETTFSDHEDFTCRTQHRQGSECGMNSENFKDRKQKFSVTSKRNCSFICTNSDLILELSPAKENSLCVQAEGVNAPPRYADILNGKDDWLNIDSIDVVYTENFVPLGDTGPSEYLDKDEYRKDQLRFQQNLHNFVCEERLKRRRSLSAPPFQRGKKRFYAFNHHWPVKPAPLSAKTGFPETCQLKHVTQSSGTCSTMNSNPAIASSSKARPDMIVTQEADIDESHCLHGGHIKLDKGFIVGSHQDFVNSEIKWRCAPPAADCIRSGDRAKEVNDYSNILDISSGVLHFATDLLVPESINKICLEDAKVLKQVDKKFIPIVASGTLAIIDQHAADERIRLEELRRKVLSGEMKTISYLDAEQELVLPEFGYQLLHNYAHQVENWGWICNRSCGSRSIAKNLNLLHKQPPVIKLIAVPHILGVDLSDVDLLEFLQQLGDTDGSSTIPPSVLRLLNSKACRGAIMFGDALLPSECSLMVEELKQTSLCFQCAHGRPTTVPLVDLEALHKHIAKLGTNGDSEKSWHGLQRHTPNQRRAAQRLQKSKDVS